MKGKRGRPAKDPATKVERVKQSKKKYFKSIQLVGSDIKKNGDVTTQTVISKLIEGNFPKKAPLGTISVMTLVGWQPV